MQLVELNIWDLNKDILISLVLSLVCGLVLGVEREISNKWAGIRTHMLVCLGSCVFTILSIYGFPIFVDPSNIHSHRFGDPTRIAAQILTGIGFIGGGTVLRHGTSVSGLTTAATLWLAASIGMACACKMYYLALFVTPVVVGVIVLIRFFEKRFLGWRHPVRAQLSLQIKYTLVDTLYEILCQKGDILSFQKKPSESNYEMCNVKAILRLKTQNPVQVLYQQMSTLDTIDALNIQELNEKE